MVTGAAPAALPRALRLAVSALTLLLPGTFRARQRAEWTGDLMSLPDGRWRYLFGAAWTLPALRAAALHAGHTRGAPAAVRSSGATVMAGHILLAGLGWPVLSWLVSVPVRYFSFGIPARLAAGEGPIDPKDLWPTGPLFFALLPLIFALTIGAYVALMGGPILAATLGLAGTLVGAAHRRMPLALASLAAGVAALLVVATGLAPDLAADRGYGIALLGTVAVGMGLFARTLQRGRRAWLVLVGVAAMAVLAAHHTSAGFAMHTWFLD